MSANAPPQTARQIADQLHRIDYSRQPHQIFTDFCDLAYFAIAETTADDDANIEKQYMQVVARYQERPGALQAFAQTLGAAHILLHIHGEDILGEIARELGIFSANLGQYMTPMPICRMMAKTALPELQPLIDQKGFIHALEPACGSGTMLLGLAQEIRAQGYDPASQLLVEAQDISQIYQRMCYIQLALMGIPAIVIHGDSLSSGERFEHHALTPAILPFYFRHQKLFEPENSIAVRKPEQLTLL